MVSRVLSRLRAALSALALLIFLTPLLPATAGAINPYSYTDQAEGDPGDGVLEPKFDNGRVGGSDAKESDLLAGFDAGPSLNASDYLLVPVYISAGHPGLGTYIFVPRTWSRPILGTILREWGWPHAP